MPPPPPPICMAIYLELSMIENVSRKFCDVKTRLKKSSKMAEGTYDSWLSEKLRSLQLDEDVFLDYLKGVLEEDSTSEEKVETIDNILQGATVSTLSTPWTYILSTSVSICWIRVL